jgi:hypothetical protein
MNLPALSSLAASVAQEATETTAQTKIEAAKGDPQAIRRLARLQAAQHAASAPQSAPGPAVTKGGLNAVA